jgi:hypothetical protein
MKRMIVLLGMVSLCAGILPAEKSKLILTVHGNYFSLAKNNLTSQSSETKVFAEGKAAVTFSGNLYAWGSFGFFPLKDGWDAWSSKAVFEADLHVDRKLDKQVFSGGVGYFIGFFALNEIAVRLELGACYITNDIGSAYNTISSGDTVKTVTASQSAFGGRANLGITYGFYKKLFGEATIGFMYAPDKSGGERSNLGGFNLSLGIGIKL